MNPGGPQIELVTHSPQETQRLGEALAMRLIVGDVVALVGHLGAGKTQWVKGLARGLGIDPDDVHSPTFTLINEYPSASGQSPSLYHVDVYRLGQPAELEAIGFVELLAAADGLIAVEWADRVRELIPPSAVWIEGAMPSALGPNERLYRIRCERGELLDALRVAAGRPSPAG